MNRKDDSLNLIKSDVRINPNDKQAITEAAIENTLAFPDMFRAILKFGIRNYIGGNEKLISEKITETKKDIEVIEAKIEAEKIELSLYHKKLKQLEKIEKQIEELDK